MTEPGDFSVEPPAQPPPTILPDEPHPRAPREWSAYIAWTIIILISGFLMIAAAKPEMKGRAASGESVTDLQLTVAAKNIVGIKALLSMADGTTQPTTAPAGDPRIAALQLQVDSLARNPQEKLRAAIIAAEVHGPAEALQRLDALDNASLPTDLREDLSLLREIYSGDSAALTPEERQRLIDRHRYFAKMALSFGAPASDPLRREVIAEGRLMLVLNIVIAVAGFGAAFIGIVLFVIAIVLFLTGTIRRRYVPQPQAPPVFVEMFAVWLVSYVLLSLLISLALGSHPRLVWSWLLALALPIALGWGAIRGLSWNQLRTGLGWHRGRGWLIEIPLGLVGYLAGLPIIAVGSLITVLLVTHSNARPSHPIINEPVNSAVAVLALFSIASIFAPVIEETFFRGALLHHLRRRWGWLFSASVVALIFAAIHPQGLATIPALASIAIVLAGLREWRGTLIAPIAAHAFHNGVLITLLVLTSQ